MPRIISLVHRDLTTHRLDAVTVFVGRKPNSIEVVIRVIPAIAAHGGRTFELELIQAGKDVRKFGTEVAEMRALRDRLTELLDEHFDNLSEMTRQ